MPVGSRSFTTTFVPVSGPLFDTVIVNVIVSPTLGVGSLTAFSTTRSACFGVTVDSPVFWFGLGSGVVDVAVAVFFCGSAGWPEAGVFTVATIVSVLVTPASTFPTVQTPVFEP